MVQAVAAENLTVERQVYCIEYFVGRFQVSCPARTLKTGHPNNFRHKK